MSNPDTTADEALRVLEMALSGERRAQIDAIVTGDTPMERWERHTGVTTFAHLQEWAERQLREVMTMRAYRDIANGGVPKDDELGDYLVGKSAALSMMLANMRQIMEQEAASNVKLTATSDDIGSSYFARSIGVKGHQPAKYEKYSASHPVTINKVYQEALTRFPEAADVIAAMAFWRQIGFNRDEFIRSSEAQRETNNVE